MGVTAGRFVSFEGVDGCGKTTQAALFTAALTAAGIDVLAVREPGGTALGERLRGVLLDSPSGSIDPRAEVYLFAAARAQLVHEVIVPALARGTWVVADRFVDSSLAYQGVARGLGLDAVWRVNEPFTTSTVLPAATVLLRIGAEEAAARRHTTGQAPDRIEAEGERLQELVADGYRQVADRFPERVVVVEAAGDAQTVHQRVWRRLAALREAAE